MAENENNKKIRKLINIITESSGAAFGGITSSIIGGPAGGFAGGIFGVVITRTLGEFANRLLSFREEEKLDVTARSAISEIEKRFQLGEKPRSDGFFSKNKNGRTKAEEVFEAALFKAKDEAEELKLEFIGKAFANISFRDDISAASAHFILKIADKLTYQQMCFLSFVSKMGEVDVECLRRDSHAIHDLNVLQREEMSLHETDLGTLGLLSGEGPWEDKLSQFGETVVEILGLKDIPAEHVKTIKDLINKTKMSNRI